MSNGGERLAALIEAERRAPGPSPAASEAVWEAVRERHWRGEGPRVELDLDAIPGPAAMTRAWLSTLSVGLVLVGAIAAAWVLMGPGHGPSVAEPSLEGLASTPATAEPSPRTSATDRVPVPIDPSPSAAPRVPEPAEVPEAPLRAHDDEAAPAPHAPSRTDVRPAASTEGLERTPEPEPDTASKPPRPRPRQPGSSAEAPGSSERAASAVADEASLSEEIALLARAWARLRDGDVAIGLALLDEHQRSYPDSMLTEERAAARTLGWCLETPASGPALARAFHQRYPGSPYGKRLRSACEDSAPSDDQSRSDADITPP